MKREKKKKKKLTNGPNNTWCIIWAHSHHHQAVVVVVVTVHRPRHHSCYESKCILNLFLFPCISSEIFKTLGRYRWFFHTVTCLLLWLIWLYPGEILEMVGFYRWLFHMIMWFLSALHMLGGNHIILFDKEKVIQMLFFVIVLIFCFIQTAGIHE